jgi:DNA-directed RNA polymerase specialized sigma24 family protein
MNTTLGDLDIDPEEVAASSKDAALFTLRSYSERTEAMVRGRRELVHMAKKSGATLAEIAEVVGVSPQTIKNWLDSRLT